MKISESDINREGFAVLHGKWNIIGLNGTKVSKNADPSTIARDDKSRFLIGYLSYPNPKLKNDIPDRQFYRYKSVKRSFVIPTLPEGSKTARFQTSGRLEQSVTKSEYIKKILQIKKLLAAGEIYQLDYAIRFRKKFKGNPYALFLKLVDVNPTDFSAYLNCGGFQIISNSPERLFKVQKNKIITQPIKGTAPKDYELRITNYAKLTNRNSESVIRNPSQKKKYTDPNLIKLINSEKERAELDMITDLERNDVGKICKYGTLKLAKERELLEMKNIWHTYSEVGGELESGLQLNYIIKAMFPGGSITGCPKKRAMEYIEKLEGIPRNIFTGSIGYIFNDVTRAPCAVRREKTRVTSHESQRTIMDFNICIRTALVRNGYIEYWAGGGIVADSDPEKEYNECLLKAERFLDII